jgi:hypothetical protein
VDRATYRRRSLTLTGVGTVTSLVAVYVLSDGFTFPDTMSPGVLGAFLGAVATWVLLVEVVQARWRRQMGMRWDGSIRARPDRGPTTGRSAR